MNLLNYPWTERDQAGRAVFIYDLDELRAQAKRVHLFLRQFSARSEIAFSIKSNPHPKILACLMNEISGFDVSSELELQLCRRLGISGSRISVSGPGKTDACLKLAQEMKIQVLQIDSLDEFQVAQQIGIENLSFRIHANDIFSTKLGMSESEISRALNSFSKKALGLHLYLGRESFSWKRLQDVSLSMQKWFQAKPQSFVDQPHLFIGPGIPGQWSTAEAPSEPASNLPTTFELGRGLVASCGYYAAPVLSRKLLDRGGEAVIIHGGLQHLGSPFVTFAQKVQELKAQVIRQGRLLSEEPGEFLVAGSLCLGHDILHPRLKLPRNIQRGDWIVFPQAGAYGLTAGVPFFIGQDLPSEVIFENGRFTESTLTDFKLYQDSFA